MFMLLVRADAYEDTFIYIVLITSIMNFNKSQTERKTSVNRATTFICKSSCGSFFKTLRWSSFGSRPWGSEPLLETFLVSRLIISKHLVPSIYSISIHISSIFNCFIEIQGPSAAFDFYSSTESWQKPRWVASFPLIVAWSVNSRNHFSYP